MKRQKRTQNSAEGARERDRATTYSKQGNKGETHAAPWQMFCQKNSLPSIICLISWRVFVRVHMQRAASGAKYLAQLSAENGENRIFFDLFFWISNPVFQAPLTNTFNCNY